MKSLIVIFILSASVAFGQDTYRLPCPDITDCWVEDDYGIYRYPLPPAYGAYGRQKSLNYQSPDLGKAMNQAEKIKQLRLQNELLRRQLEAGKLQSFPKD